MGVVTLARILDDGASVIRICDAATFIVDAEDVDAVLDRKSWRVGSNGYVLHYNRRANRKVMLHRMIAGCRKNDGVIVDHRNGDKLDNRRCNLRRVSNLVNSTNRAVRTCGTSQYRGVCWNSAVGRWQAQQKIRYRSFYLGLFDTEAEAADAVRDFRTANGLDWYGDA